MNQGYTAERKRSKDTKQTLTSLEQARRIAALAQEKLAEDVVILDMRPECSFTDYFVIATGRNPRQTAAIWDEVHARLKQDERLLPRSVDGVREGAWIVADYLDVVLHVFTPEAREYYRLEDLWNDVPAVDARRRRGLSRPDSTRAGEQHVADLGRQPVHELAAESDVDAARVADADPDRAVLQVHGQRLALQQRALVDGRPVRAA